MTEAEILEQGRETFLIAVLFYTSQLQSITCYMSHLKPPLNLHHIPYNIPCNALLTCTIQEDETSSKRSMADMELELKAMKGDNQKWKDMCHAMQAKLIEVRMGEEEEDEERVIKDRMMECSAGDEQFTEEELRMVMRIEEEVKRVSAAASTATATASATASASKSSSTVASSVSKGSNKESHGAKEKVMEQEQEQEKEKEKEKKVTVMKDRKRPKDIKENPPSRGKNLTSKDKASSKKTKQKPKK